MLSGESRDAVDILLGGYTDGSPADAPFLKAHGGDRIDRYRAGKDGDRITVANPAIAVGLMVQDDKVGQLVQHAWPSRCSG